MKKCTLILMFILTITACKKENEESTTVATETNAAPPSNCITLEGYYTSDDTESKAEWLRQRGDSVCACTLEESVLETHRVKGIVSNQKERYVISWGKLKEKIGSYGYNAYLNVAAVNDEKIDSLIMAERYENKGFYFSTALIRSLAKKYAKDDNSEFRFSFAKLNQKSVNYTNYVVVIQVFANPDITNSAEETPYFDYSTDPSKTNPSLNLNIPL